MTIDDWMRCAGIPLGEIPTMRHHGDTVEISWPAQLAGHAGWWWALVFGDTVLRAGWSMGAERDRDADITAAMRTTVAQ